MFKQTKEEIMKKKSKEKLRKKLYHHMQEVFEPSIH